MSAMRLGVFKHHGHGWSAWTASGVCECGTVWVTAPAPFARIALKVLGMIECSECGGGPKIGEDVYAAHDCDRLLGNDAGVDRVVEVRVDARR